MNKLIIALVLIAVIAYFAMTPANIFNQANLRNWFYNPSGISTGELGCMHFDDIKAGVDIAGASIELGPPMSSANPYEEAFIEDVKAGKYTQCELEYTITYYDDYTKVKIKPCTLGASTTRVYLTTGTLGIDTDGGKYTNSEADVCGSFTFSKGGVVPPEPPPEPPVPPVTLWDWIVDAIWSWLQSLWSWLTPATISGGGTYQPGDSITFGIDMSSPIDSECSDGLCQFQYSSWAVIDSSGNIVQESGWVQSYGSYVDSVTITAPVTTGKYAFVGILYNYDMVYSDSWIIESEYIASKEATEFTVGHEAPTPPIPGEDLLTNIISAILDFLKSIFSWLGL